MRTHLALALAVALTTAAGPASSQNSKDTEQRLKQVRTELKSVAAERRKIEGQRGDASRKLRAADEEVGRVGRAVRDTERALARDTQALAELQQRRDTLNAGLAARREELAQLLRAAYTVGDDTPLKALLAQDRVDDAQRTLAYHRYAQRDRAARMQAIVQELQEVDALEREITERRTALDNDRRKQRDQLASLETARRDRAKLVDQLDEKYKDRATRERALGQDAKALQQLLAQLRAAAAKAARDKAAADKRAAAERRAATAKPKAGDNTTASVTPLRRNTTTGPALQVGGLSWPVNGSLLARYGGPMPDGRTSQGVLIAAPAGTTVKAVADGRVVFADWMNGYGLILIIDHGNGYMSLYAHNDALLRDAGDAVRRGEALASVGNSGGQGRAALYFELRRNGQPVNPDAWLKRQ
ncbi:peptidoglycan DD-metalloendopeptidase family protein [Lysobacter sp. A6]|uniref:Peptidoglycan DD-metalloendopeptidase family protein n=1 Tax=Noviluteimonas lactosilytica TaxID=2888523 RepID=A0ABS8JKW3_9GAMM|nr:peptidoglycan DD-metalloendopeptidase family protein [Lysobacter lactosilyticus]MCC8364192.1 peptidoglycan DD-metalloendopeptidase family protein [Lysobacter lactosilyticus]